MYPNLLRISHVTNLCVYKQSQLNMLIPNKKLICKKHRNSQHTYQAFFFRTIIRNFTFVQEIWDGLDILPEKRSQFAIYFRMSSSGDTSVDHTTATGVFWYGAFYPLEWRKWWRRLIAFLIRPLNQLLLRPSSLIKQKIH